MLYDKVIVLEALYVVCNMPVDVEWFSVVLEILVVCQDHGFEWRT